MAIIRNIWESYRRPQAVFDRLVREDHAETTALGFLAIGCALAFVSRWPELARQSHITEQPLDMMLGGALFGWIFVAPLLFYGVGGIMTLAASVMGSQARGSQIRLLLFWSFLASAPLLLIYGLASGFWGQDIVTRVIGIIWVCAFLFFLLCGFKATRRDPV